MGRIRSMMNFDGEPLRKSISDTATAAELISDNINDVQKVVRFRNLA